MASSILARMAVIIDGQTAQFNKAMAQSQGQLRAFTSDIGGLAKTVGIAFGVQQVAAFGLEIVKLSGEAKAVSDAFNRFPDSVRLLNDLKEATAGTVSELELMKRTVQASNFGIELQSLPKLLEFAAIRAQQTGQSVDYLVDSIVTGIGRKSPLILDNLGISAVRLKEKLGGVTLEASSIGDVSAAVGAIAGEELEKMGSFSENAATKVARLTASWENFKVVLGNVATAGGVLGNVLDDLTGILSAISDGDQANFIQYQKNLAESIKNDSEPAIKSMMKELIFLRNELKTPISETFAKTLINDFKLSEDQSKRFLQIIRDINGEVKKAAPVKVVDPIQVTTLESLQAKIKQLNDQFATTDVNDRRKLANIGQEIIAVNAQVKALEELRKAREGAGVSQPDTVAAYEEALKKLNVELENTNVKDTARLRILSAQIAGYDEAIKKVEDLKRSFQKFDFTIKPPDVTPLLNAVKLVKEAVGGIEFTKIVTATEEMTARIEGNLKRMAESVKKTTTSVGEAFEVDLKPMIISGLSGIGEAIGQAAVGVGSFGDNIIKVVAGFARQLGEILISTGVAMLAIKKFAISNPVAAIAAGVALVALASAASSAIGKSHSNSFGGGGGSSMAATNNASAVSASATQAQDVNVNVSGVIRGQDIYVILKNVEHNNKFLKAGG